MTIALPITWTDPGPPRSGVVTVTFDEVKLPEGYRTRKITHLDFPPGFPRDQQAEREKSIYHLLNKERQRIIPDDARAQP